MTANAPRLQNGPVLWAAFCAFGLGLSGWVVVSNPRGSEGWWVGVLLGFQAIISLVVIEAWWLMSQREVSFLDGVVRIRRWSDVLLRRDGRSLPVSSIRAVMLILKGGKKIRIVADNAETLTFWAALWPLTEVDGLIHAAQVRGISVTRQW